MAKVSVVIPTIAPRYERLAQAVQSVQGQTFSDIEIVVSEDTAHRGAASNRNDGLFRVTSEWTAFLDDDDIFYPQHIEHLLALAEETSSDLVYPWFDITGRGDFLSVPVNGVNQNPFGVVFTEEQKQFTIHHGNFIPVTTLVKTEIAHAVGGFPEPNTDAWPHPDCEDWGFLVNLLKADAKFTHLPERTWVWNHWGGNTAGRVDRW